MSIKILPGWEDDKTPWEELLWQAKMNVQLDRLAGKDLQYG